MQVNQTLDEDQGTILNRQRFCVHYWFDNIGGLYDGLLSASAGCWSRDPKINSQSGRSVKIDQQLHANPLSGTANCSYRIAEAPMNKHSYRQVLTICFQVISIRLHDG